MQNQLDKWLSSVAHTRTHATLKARPVDLLHTDREATRPLPPYAPAIGIRPAVRLPRNYYITVDTNQYSVDPSFIGRLVTVRTSLTDIIVKGPAGEIAAHHQRVWARHRVITAPAHQQAAHQIRQQLKQANQRIHSLGSEIEIADLSIYDWIA